MDKFSELIKNGVAAFHHEPKAPEVTCNCPICREYNNIYSISNDTHMSCMPDGKKIITGSIIKNQELFNSFMYSVYFRHIDFRTSGSGSFSSWMQRHNLKGEYKVSDNDYVYILSEITDDDRKISKELSSFTTSESKIPTSVRFLSKKADAEDLKECFKENIYDTVKAMNESRNIYGDNWHVAYMSDGLHVVGDINTAVYDIK